MTKLFSGSDALGQWLKKQIDSDSLSSIEIYKYLIENGFEHPQGGVDWLRWAQFKAVHGIPEKSYEQELRLQKMPLALAHRLREFARNLKELDKEFDSNTEKISTNKEFDFDEGRIKKAYILKTNSFSIEDFLDKLQPERKVEILIHILNLHQKTSDKLIKELLDEDKNDLITSLIDKITLVTERAATLSKMKLYSFYIAGQDLIYESLESAINVSEQFKKIYTLLGVTKCINGETHLNLEILNSNTGDVESRQCELKKLIDNYFSFLPKVFE